MEGKNDKNGKNESRGREMTMTRAEAEGENTEMAAEGEKREKPGPKKPQCAMHNDEPRNTKIPETAKPKTIVFSISQK